MTFNSGFYPTYDGFIQFTTASFGVSRSMSAFGTQRKIFHNLEWLYGTSTQVRVNWVSENGLKVGTEETPLTPGSASLLYSDGPFILSMTDEGIPMPLFVKVEAGINSKPAAGVTGTLSVHLRQRDLIAEVFTYSELGTVEIKGENGSRDHYQFTTPSSSLSTSSSLLEIQGAALRPYFKLPIRTTRSLSGADENSMVVLCWLDFYGTPVTGSGATNGFAIYSVFAQEFCPRLESP